MDEKYREEGHELRKVHKDLALLAATFAPLCDTQMLIELQNVEECEATDEL